MSTEFTKVQLREIYRRKFRNQELSLDEFYEKKLTLKSRPSKLLLQLTENCNFRCVMCQQLTDPKYARYNPELNMPLELFDRVASELFDDAYSVDLRGLGEAVTLPYWPDILDRIEAYPLINWHLVTNLSLPQDSTWVRMMKCGFLLGISMDGATRATFEAIRLRSHFATVLHNLELISSTLKHLGSGHLYFVVTVQKKNIQELPQIIELARRFSVNEVQFKIAQGSHHAEGIEPAQFEELSRAVSRSMELALEHDIELSLDDSRMLGKLDRQKTDCMATYSRLWLPLNWPPGPELDPEFNAQNSWHDLAAKLRQTWHVKTNKTCFKPQSFTHIAYDGRVGTCHYMTTPEIHVMGNLKKESFDQIWNGERYRFFRASLARGTPYDQRCQGCFKYRIGE